MLTSSILSFKFQEWAVHTGRFTQGVDQADWPTWKTRFRCALTKLPDIKELKEQNQLEGNIAEPYRVYQFVQRTRKSWRSFFDTWANSVAPGEKENI